MIFWILSGVAALVLGLVLRSVDRRGPTRGHVDARRLTLLQIAYSCLLAYPFCVLWVLVDRALE